MNSLWIYAMLGNCTEAEKLLIEGVDINSANGMGSTAIIEAANHAELEMVELLLMHNASLNVRNLKGDTVLTVAMRYIDRSREHAARIKIILLLKQHGAFLDITHPTDKKVLADFKSNVSVEEFKDCFPEFCKTPNEGKTASWSSSFAKQFPFLQGWFTFTSPPTSQELQAIHANNNRQIHGSKQIKME